MKEETTIREEWNKFRNEKEKAGMKYESADWWLSLHHQGMENLRWKIENLPEKEPEYESDEYDLGMQKMKKLVLSLIPNHNE